MKKRSEIEAKSLEAAGRKSTSFFLTDDEKKKIKDFADDIGMSQREAILAAIDQYYRQGKPDVPAVLEKLAKELRAKKW